MNKLPIISFDGMTWQEIPDQDNPAMTYRNDPKKGKIHDECVIICKAMNAAKAAYESKEKQ